MMARQAEAIRRVADLDLDAPAARLSPARRVLLVGTGTSHHAAELGALVLEEGGMHAEAISAASFARWPPAARAGDVVVLISHTGQTAYARAVRHGLLGSDRPFISITGPEAGWPEAIETPVAERSETYTVSYVATLAVLALLAHRLGVPGLGPALLEDVAEHVEALVAKEDPAELAPPLRAMAIVGVGPAAVTAREGALKIREAARVLCEGFDAERLLHGAAVPYGAGDALVVLQPDADPDGLLDSLSRAAAAEGMAVATIAPSAPSSSAFLAQIPLTVRLQRLAAHFAERLGTDPDRAIVGGWASPALWEAGSPG